MKGDRYEDYSYFTLDRSGALTARRGLRGRARTRSAVRHRRYRPKRCYNDRTEIPYPQPGQLFFGQDAHYNGNQPDYRDNGDGTVTDLVTGLMWQADPGSKKTYAEAAAGAAKCRTGGYDDWRLPTIKELYSLIQFSGTDPDPMSRDSSRQRPFIDTQSLQVPLRRGGRRRPHHRLAVGHQHAVRRPRDAEHAGDVRRQLRRRPHQGLPGRPRSPRRGEKTFYVIYVRGNPDYGKNDFVDNGDGTVTDRATGLTWMQVDSAALKAGASHDGKLNWAEALVWAENLNYAGHDDWRLPNAKELQSIVDYTRSPDTTGSAAIDPVFEATPINNEGGAKDFGCYWSSTTHARVSSADAAVYVAFGRALGFMSPPGAWNAPKQLMDVHGAGAQRSDLKSGNPATLPQGRGPQGDVMRIYNLVRCVRGGTAEPRATGPKVEMQFARHRPEPPGSLDERPGPPPSGPMSERRGSERPGPMGERRAGRPPSGAEWVRRLDRDGDSKVSRREFDGPAEHFTDFDRDRDGYITAREAPAGPPSSNQNVARCASRQS